jgi:YNFM family putative membrane transporter
MGHLAGQLGRRKVLWTAFALMLFGVVLTMMKPLLLIMLGIVAITFGFFGGHSIVSSWVGRRAGAAKAQASSMYLFRTTWARASPVPAAACSTRTRLERRGTVRRCAGAGWFADCTALYRLPPLVNVATPPTPMSKGAMP